MHANSGYTDVVVELAAGRRICRIPRASTSSAATRGRSSTSARPCRCASASPPTSTPAASGAKEEALRRLHREVETIVDAHRARGAAPREHPHQEAPSPVQRLPARRQDLSLHQDHDRRGLAAGSRHAAGPGGRPLLLRPVLGRPGPADHADDHAPLPDPDLHARDRRKAARGPASTTTSTPASDPAWRG